MYKMVILCLSSKSTESRFQVDFNRSGVNFTHLSQSQV